MPNISITNSIKSFVVGSSFDIARSEDMILQFLIPETGATVTLPCTIYATLTVDWGDGNVIEYISPDVVTHDYGSTEGDTTRTVTISGAMSNFGVSSWDVDNLLTKAISFGTELGLTSLSSAFRGCGNLTDIPNYLPRGITVISDILRGCNSLNSANTSNWDTQDVVTMTNAFREMSIFNKPIFNDFTSLGRCIYMFYFSKDFNQDVSNIEFNPDFIDILQMFGGTDLDNTNSYNYDKFLISLANWCKSTYNGKGKDKPINKDASQFGLKYLGTAIPGWTVKTWGATSPVDNAIDAKDYLIETLGWTIVDGGQH